MPTLTFITEEDFKNHVKETIQKYLDSMEPMDLEKFNSNIIDPIKLMFDKEVQNKSFEEVIADEIHRQRDKTHSNAIGYFHQNMFKYIANCVVPTEGFDVVYTDPVTNKHYYVEMKNKHNTMNSGAAKSVYIKCQNQLLKEPGCTTMLVEVIAKNSQNIVWNTSVDKVKVANENIRRVSIDKFYELVTGDANAFYKICKQLPLTIRELVDNGEINVDNNTVLAELRQKNPDILKALFTLAFSTYNGFDNL